MRAGAATFVVRANRLRIVFDHTQIVRSRKIQNRIHVARKSVKMNRNNRASPRRYAAREIGRIEIVGVGANVGKDWFGAKRADGAAGGDKRERRDQHFVAGLNAAGAQRKDKCVSSGCDTDAMRYAAELCNFLFECGAFAAKNELLRRENTFDGRSNFRANGSVLCRKIELRHGLEQGSGLWMRAHRSVSCSSFVQKLPSSNESRVNRALVQSAEYTPSIRRKRQSPI